jgi:hypothetical protein
VAHHLGAGACVLTRADRTFERLQTVLGDHILGHAHLRAEHHIAVLRNRPRRDIGLRKVDVVELSNREAREPDVGYVHEGIDTRARLRRDVAAERSKVVGTGIPRRHAGGRALIRDQLVGRNADGRAIGIDVRVEVDEPRRHELAAGVEHALRALRRDICFERLDHTEADTNVTPSAQALAGIEDVATLDDKIELVIWTHGGARRAFPGGQKGERTGGGEKLAARDRH